MFHVELPKSTAGGYTRRTRKEAPAMASSTKPRAPRLGRGLSALMAQPVEVAPFPTPASPPVSPPASPAPELSAGGASPTSGPSHAAPGTHARDAAAPAHRPAGDGLRYLPLADIQPNRHQPRQRFDPLALESLAASIRAQGVMQPIVVRPTPVGASGAAGDVETPAFELVAGERRWRAAQLAGLAAVPAIVRDLDDRQLAEWALVENLQREDLNPIERAEAFHQLTTRFNLSHAAVAEQLGLDRSTVTNMLRLLELDSEVRSLVRDDLLSMGQARALAGLSDPLAQRALATKAVAEGMSVRAVEQAVKQATGGGAGTDGKGGDAGDKAAAVKAAGGRAAYLADLEQQLATQLTTKVRIRPGRRKGSGTLAIDFYSLEQFDALLSRLGVTTD